MAEKIARIGEEELEELGAKEVGEEKEVYARTGERTIYTANVTDRPDRIKENAKRAVDEGVNGLMVNYLTAGISTLQTLAEDPDIGVLRSLNIDQGIADEDHFVIPQTHLLHGANEHFRMGLVLQDIFVPQDGNEKLVQSEVLKYLPRESSKLIGGDRELKPPFLKPLKHFAAPGSR
jgi:hypothetical protein